MRVRLAFLSLALLAAAVHPASALTALDSTGTTYSTDPVRVPMVFPVAGGQTSFTDTFLACRSGCARKHMGQDLMGAKMTPLVAAFDGVVSSLKRETTIGGGNYLVINGDNGWSAVYVHLNNDTPGTDDGRGTASFAFPKGIEVGTRVMAGQLVGWRGDSGDAESTGAHLHFELRKGSGWSGIVYNAYPSLVAARRIAVPVPSGPHPDGSLLRTAAGAFFVTDGTVKHPVTAAVLTANGWNPASAVTATAAEFRRYQTGPAVPLRGALRVVRYLGSTYVVGEDEVLHAADRYVLASHGLANAPVVDLPDPNIPVDPNVPVDPTVVPATAPVIGDPLGLRDGTLVAISGVGPAVVSHGVVRRIWDSRENAAYGYAGKPRLVIPAALVSGWAVRELAGTDSAYRSWR